MSDISERVQNDIAEQLSGKSGSADDLRHEIEHVLRKDGQTTEIVDELDGIRPADEWLVATQRAKGFPVSLHRAVLHRLRHDLPGTNRRWLLHQPDAVEEPVPVRSVWAERVLEHRRPRRQLRPAAAHLVPGTSEGPGPAHGSHHLR